MLLTLQDLVKIQKDHDYISKTSSNIFSKRENLAENTKNGSSGSYKQLLQKLFTGAVSASIETVAVSAGAVFSE